jgi:N-acyl-D-amino-acid deacylase
MLRAFLLVALLSAAGTLGAQQPAPRPEVTLVVTNARLADGSGGPLAAGRAVVVARDTIVAIEDAARYRPPAGARVIDASGLVLAPGFIDMHTHADSGLEAHPDAASQVRQGITTALGGQDGGCPCPLGEYFARLERQGIAINLAATAGFGWLRGQAMGADTRRPARPEEIARMRALFEAELRAGAFGLSSGLEYEPDSFSTTDELVEVAALAKRYGGFYISHVRDEGAKVIESFRELVQISRRAGLPAQLGHMKLGSVSAWGRMPEYRALMKEVDADGGPRITGDVYPYDFWHSTLRVLVLSRRYDDPAEVRRGVDDNGGPENILLARYAPYPAFEGQSLKQIATEQGKDPYALYMEMIRETDPERRKPEWGDRVESILGVSMREEDIRDFYRDPRVMVSSDGAIAGAHPRGAGAFPRFLGRYVREAKLLPLGEGVRRMTALPASVLGLRDRGRIAAGMKADLVVFDPATVIDRATVQDPAAAPEGIPYVVVNGELVVDGGGVTAARPGRVLRATAR